MAGLLRIAWLTTGRGPGSYGALQYVLEAIKAGLPVEISAVFVNRDLGEAEPTDRLLALAGEHDIESITLSSVRFRRERGGQRSKPGEALPEWRLDYDREVARLLEGHDFSLGVMFGYMLIATEPLFSRFQFINDHPALPDGPIGTYQDVIAQLIRSQATESGCMMNLVTGDVDRGPALSYCRFPLREASNQALWRGAAADPATPERSTRDLETTPLFADIRQRGVVRERPFLAETLRSIAAGSLTIPPQMPVDLTDSVERSLTTR